MQRKGQGEMRVGSPQVRIGFPSTPLRKNKHYSHAHFFLLQQAFISASPTHHAKGKMITSMGTAKVSKAEFLPLGAHNPLRETTRDRNNWDP